eukprot:362704-Hanusia_phi.AAC.3
MNKNRVAPEGSLTSTAVCDNGECSCLVRRAFSLLDEIEAISQDDTISTEKRVRFRFFPSPPPHATSTAPPVAVCLLSRGDIDDIRKTLAARPA